MTTLNIRDIEAQLVASADEVKAELHAKRQEKKAIEADIRELVAQHKKAERLAKVVRKELEKQSDIESLRAVPDDEAATA